jgi:hypothetical protein
MIANRNTCGAFLDSAFLAGARCDAPRRAKFHTVEFFEVLVTVAAPWMTWSMTTTPHATAIVPSAGRLRHCVAPVHPEERADCGLGSYHTRGDDSWNHRIVRDRWVIGGC